eukprot:scaffold10469_cov118-Isochrysis_galbana.AAC.2
MIGICLLFVFCIDFAIYTIHDPRSYATPRRTQPSATPMPHARPHCTTTQPPLSYSSYPHAHAHSATKTSTITPLPADI